MGHWVSLDLLECQHIGLTSHHDAGSCVGIVFLSFFLSFFLCFGRTAQLVGSQFPDQGLNPGHGSENTKSSPLDRQGSPMGRIVILGMPV